MTAIFVDGDACPVKAEVEKVASRHGLPVTIVSNGGLRPSANPLLRHVTVAQGADAGGASRHRTLAVASAKVGIIACMVMISAANSQERL